MSSKRLPIYYTVLTLVAGSLAVLAIVVGSGRDAQPAIAGPYEVADGPARACLGSTFDIRQSGQFVAIEGGDAGASGNLRFQEGRITGDVSCVEGGTRALDLRVEDEQLRGRVAGTPVEAERTGEAPEPGAQEPRVPGAISGEYAVAPRSECLGGAIELEGGGAAPHVVAEGRELGTLRYADGQISGRVECAEGGAAAISGTAVDRRLQLTVTPAGGEAERVVANKQREFGLLLAAFFIAVAVVMLAARAVGSLAVRLGQPRVMGEVAAGILLGPTFFGLLLPDVQQLIFPLDVIPLIGVAANLGLIFYMFLVGLELDTSQLKGRVTQAVAISNTSVVIPMVLGLLVAIPTYELVGPDDSFLSFGLFMGVAMSITAFPVLARILSERRMLKRPVGAMALACAAVDDVTAWFLIALATAVAVAGSASGVVRTIALAVAFCLVMGFLVRPFLQRLSVAYEEAGRVPVGWITAIFAGVLLSAFTTEIIGIALIFGAFIMGAVMPRHAGLTEDVTRRMEDFVVLLLLPLFFCYTGLRTNMALLDRPELVVLTLVLIAVAIVCKFGGTVLAARVTGLGWRESSVLGTLMNTRGLTELIVLNLALEKGVISEALFAALVLMALVTTFMAGPLLKLLDPRNEFGAPVEEELEEARRASAADLPAIPVPESAILVASQNPDSIGSLVELAEPLARSEPPRELILTRLVRPTRGAAARGGLQTENRLVSEAQAQLQRERDALARRGVAARAVAFASASVGEDLKRLAGSQDVHLLLVDGRRRLLGTGLPTGEVGEALRDAPCDVGVLVARESEIVLPGPDRPVTVPFGGAEHDWAALELGAWIASATEAPLRMIGVASDNGDQGDKAGRRLADASLLVQGFAGVAAETRIVTPGREAILDAAQGSGLLMLGLSERWREEGLGELRGEIVREAAWPILFVRRGSRPGALAPRDTMTQFAWSRAGQPLMGG